MSLRFFLDLAVVGGKQYSGAVNVSMLDARMALEWIRDNISRFGGDPGNVMLFGQSAGGGTVNTLLTMPSAKGLFHRAAVQSGSNFRALSNEDATKTTETILEKLKLKASQLDELQTLPVDRILAAASGPGVRLGPVVDGGILPEQP